MTARALVDEVPWLQALGEDARDALAQRAMPADWPAGTTICHQDDNDRTCFVLGSGSLRVARSLPDGRSVTLAHLQPPAVFGELALLGVGRRTATVTALRDSHGIAVGADDVLDALHSDPRAGLSVALDLAARLATANERLLRYSMGTAAGSVSATLLSWVQARRDAGAPDGDIEVLGGVGDIARTAGIPKRAALRFLSHLELEGTITTRGNRTVIHDPDGLARYLG
jgi:CRP/FNR family transcriptional regulator